MDPDSLPNFLSFEFVNNFCHEMVMQVHDTVNQRQSLPFCGAELVQLARPGRPIILAQATWRRLEGRSFWLNNLNGAHGEAHLPTAESLSARPFGQAHSTKPFRCCHFGKANQIYSGRIGARALRSSIGSHVSAGVRHDQQTEEMLIHPTGETVVRAAVSTKRSRGRSSVCSEHPNTDPSLPTTVQGDQQCNDTTPSDEGARNHGLTGGAD